MLKKPEISKNNDQLITEIEEESLIIIEVIKSSPSKRSMKILHWLSHWLSQKPNLLPDNTPILAIVINTMYKYFTTKVNGTRDPKIENLIEDRLCNLITNLACLPKEEIINILSCLKRAITGDVDAAVEKKINRLTSSAITDLPLFKNVSTQVRKWHEKSKLTFNTLKYPSNFFTDKLILETSSLVFGLKNPFSLSGSEDFLAPKRVKNTLSKEKNSGKKTKVRLILCGDDGIGYEYRSPQQVQKNLERKRALQPLFERKTACLSEIAIEKNMTQEELEKKIEEKELESGFFTLRDEVLLGLVIASIQKQIDKYKLKFYDNYPCLNFVLTDFKMAQAHVFFNNFIKATNYDGFKELIAFSEAILIAINKANKIIKKIDLFSKSLGISLGYMNTLDDCYEKMKKSINEEKIIEFLESALNLFKDRALTKHLNYCLVYTEGIKQIKIPQEPSFLNLFIENNCPRKLLDQHCEYLNKFFSQNSDSSLFKKKYLEQKSNYFKVFLNFLSMKHYFVNVNHKNFFVKKFLLNSYQHSDFELVKKKIFKLKWWHFILVGINPYHVFKREFRACLAKALFLNLIEEEFKNIDIEREPYIKAIDALFSIQARLKASSLNTKTESLGLYEVNAPQSRQEIIERLRNHEEVKNLLDEVQILTQGANHCINGFSKAVNRCQQENEKSSTYTKISLVESTPNPNNSTIHFSRAR